MSSNSIQINGQSVCVIIPAKLYLHIPQHQRICGYCVFFMWIIHRMTVLWHRMISSRQVFTPKSPEHMMCALISHNVFYPVIPGLPFMWEHWADIYHVPCKDGLKIWSMNSTRSITCKRSFYHLFWNQIFFFDNSENQHFLFKFIHDFHDDSPFYTLCNGKMRKFRPRLQ